MRLLLLPLLSFCALLAAAGSPAAQGDPVLPAGFEAREGSFNNAIPFGSAPLRYQQVLLAADLGPPAFLVAGLAVRPKGGMGASRGHGLDLEVLLTTTPRDHTGMSATFDDNYGAPPTVAFSRKWLPAPAFPAEPGPRPFHLHVHLDRPFLWVAATGNLLLEVRIHGNENNNRGFTYPLDAVWDGREPIPSRTTRVYSSTGPQDPTGTVGRGYGLVWQLLSSAPPTFHRFGAACAGSNGTPAISAAGVPALGTRPQALLSSAAPSSPVVLWLGASRTSFGGLALPYGLDLHGAPGCFLWTGPIRAVAAASDAIGEADVTLDVPNDPTLAESSFFAQWLVQDPAANALGIAATEGLQGTVR